MIGIPYVDNVIKLFIRKQVGDGADRLLGFATSTLLGMFAILVCTKQYVGSPMTCWAPGEFKGGWENFARDHCYIQNTYIVQYDAKAFPGIQQRKDHQQVNYYQWVPLALFLQAIVFYLPSYIWRKLYKNYGINLGAVINGSNKLRDKESSDREKALAELTVSMLETFKEQQIRPYYKCFGLAGHYSRVLTYKYILVKFLFMAVLLINFYYVTAFLHSSDSFWAIKGVHSIVSGTEWENSPSFPRVTLCDFKIFDLGNVRSFTVQCLLMMNSVNEKVFFIEWFWMCFLMVATIVYNAEFVLSIASVGSRCFKIRRLLNYPQRLNVDAAKAMIFADFIGLDGFLTLYFIEASSGERAAADIAAFLFQKMEERVPELPMQKDQKETIYPTILPSAPNGILPSAGPLPEKEVIV